MARTILPKAKLTATDGVSLVWIDASANADGYIIDNPAGHVVLVVKNEEATPVDVTIITPNKVQDLDLADKVVTVPAGETLLIGPLGTGLYNAQDIDTGITKGVRVEPVTGSVSYAVLEI